ncbi:SAVED domain-containing protein [Domibacillus tundrae]|uniref:SAVED domain-containing protein n=1 Tax=Domibacillus tundrae TaxID=1587527 RepID=UPI000617D39A|nr:SAVED domain-containing protein [Domibacillus tundrae]
MSRDAFKLSTADDRDLWVKSGGLCAKCKKPLILNDIEKKVSIGERAHIIGKGTGKNAPRREYAEEYGINEENIDSIENLMLMCSACHHTIDTNVKAYPPDDLFEMKKRHEEWVAKRLAQNNQAIAVLHKRKNSIPVDSILLADEIDIALLDAVSLQDEMTDFSLEGWEQAKRDNEEFFKKILKTKGQYPGTKLCIFSLSPIPLLIHLGKLISDTIGVVVYQFDRDTQQWCLEDKNPLGKRHIPKATLPAGKLNETLVVTIQVSGVIREEDVKQAIGSSNYDLLDISIDNPKLNSVLYKEDIEEIRKLFREKLYWLNNHNRYNEIHLFYFGPAGLAVEIGRSINESMLPEIYLYQYGDRGKQKYIKTIKI